MVQQGRDYDRWKTALKWKQKITHYPIQGRLIFETAREKIQN